MFLDLRFHNKYEKDIAPYLKNGILIDTSVFKIIVDGIVCTRITKKESPELEIVLSFLQRIKIDNKWSKFIVTPQILAEICRHMRDDYWKWQNYKNIVKEIIPLLEAMEDRTVQKTEILKSVDLQNPIMEIGDISIFVVANVFISKKEKIAIMSIDGELNKKYEYDKNVLLLDYQLNRYNLL